MSSSLATEETEPFEEITTSPVSSEDPAKAAMEEFINECGEIIERVSTQLRVIEAGLHSKETLNDVYRDVHSLKGAAFLFGYSMVGDIAHAMESSMEPLRDGTHLPSKLLIDALYKSISCVEREVECMKNGTTDEKNMGLVPMLVKVLSMATGKLEPIATEVIGTKAVEPPKQELQAEPVPEQVMAPVAVVSTPSDAPAKEKDQESSGSIRVPVALLDNLMTLMGEMVLVRNQVLQFSSKSEDLEFQNLSKR